MRGIDQPEWNKKYIEKADMRFSVFEATIYGF